MTGSSLPLDAGSAGPGPPPPPPSDPPGRGEAPDLVRRYARSAAFMVGQTIVGRILGIATNAVISRGLAPVGFGLYNLVLTTANSAYGFVRIGADIGIHIHMAEGAGATGEDRRGEILGAGLALLSALGVVGALLIVALSDTIAVSIFENAALGPWLRFAAAILLVQCLWQYAYTALAGLHEFGYFAAVSIAVAVMTLVALTAAVFLDGLRGVLYATIAVNAIGAALLGHRLRRVLASSGTVLRFRTLLRASKDLVRLGFPIYVSGLISIPVAYLIQARLTQSHGLEALGYLRIATALTTFISFIPSSIAAATISTLAAVRSDTSGPATGFLALAVANVKIIWIVSLLIAVVLFVATPLLVGLLFGSSYAAAVQVVRVSIFGVIFVAVANVTSSAFAADRRPFHVLVQVILQVVPFGVSALWLVPLMGATGYAAADWIGQLVSCAWVTAWLVSAGRRSGVDTQPLAALFGLTVLLTVLAGFALFADADLSTTMVGALVVLPLLALAGYALLTPGEAAGLGEVLRAGARTARHMGRKR